MSASYNFVDKLSSAPRMISQVQVAHLLLGLPRSLPSREVEVFSLEPGLILFRDPADVEHGREVFKRTRYRKYMIGANSGLGEQMIHPVTGLEYDRSGWLAFLRTVSF